MTAYTDLVKTFVRSQPVYEPGRPIELVAQEFGHDPGTVLKLASNENPLGPSPRGLAAAREALGEAHLYPENSSHFLRGALAERLGLDAGQIFVGRGSNEVIELLGNAFVAPGTEVVMAEHAFISYKLATLLYGGTPVEVPLAEGFRADLGAMAAAVTERTRLAFLPSPNNPTGSGHTAAEILAFAGGLPDHVIFCYDGAYVEYLDRDHAPDLRPLIAAGRKVVALRTFSKIYGLAGLRVGYAYAGPELIALLHQVRPPFNVSSAAQAAALAALDDDDFVAESRAVNAAGLAQLEGGLAALGCTPVPSQGNFILAHIGPGTAAADLFQHLQSGGVIVRPLAGYGLPEHLRFSVGTEAQNRRLLESVARFLV